MHSNPPPYQVEGEVELVGVVRRTETSERLAPATTSRTNDSTWLRRDVEAMARRVGAAPVFLDATENSSVPGGPRGGQTRVTLRNDHLEYMLTW